MRLKISDPTEGSTYRGYWSIEVLEDGELLAEVQLSREIFDDVVGDLGNAGTYRAIADLLEFLEGDEPDLWRPPDPDGPNGGDLFG
jgi:hypothetical protein